MKSQFSLSCSQIAGTNNVLTEFWPSSERVLVLAAEVRRGWLAATAEERIQQVRHRAEANAVSFIKQHLPFFWIYYFMPSGVDDFFFLLSKEYLTTYKKKNGALNYLWHVLCAAEEHSSVSRCASPEFGSSGDSQERIYGPRGEIH